MIPRNIADTVLARRSADDLRVLVRVGTRHWPELADRVLVYLLDGEDQQTKEIPVYLPDADAWVTVSVETLRSKAGPRHVLTSRPTRAQIDSAQEQVQYALNARVKVMRAMK